MKIHQSLKFQFISLFIVFLILPVCYLYYTVYKINLRWLREDIRIEFVQISERVREQFKSQVQQLIVKSTEFLLSSPLLDDYYDSSKIEKRYYKKELEILFKRIQDISLSHFKAIRLFDSEGTEEITVTPKFRKRSDWITIDKTSNSYLFELYQKMYDKSYGYYSTIDYNTNTLYVGTPVLSPLYKLTRGYLVIEFDLSFFIQYISNLTYDNKNIMWAYSYNFDILLEPKQAKNVISPIGQVNIQNIVPETTVINNNGYSFIVALRLLETDIPILYLGAGLKPEFFYTKQKELNDNMRAFFIGSVLLAILLGYIFNSLVIKPVIKLSGDAEKISDFEKGELFPIALDSKNEVGVLSRVLDSMVNKLRVRNEELESVVKQRTIVLENTNKALTKAISAQEQANSAKDKFIANVSHEIRTPLTAILGMIELSLKNDLPEEVKKGLKNAYNSGESLLIIINDILDFSKIEAGKLDIEYVDFNLSDLIKDIVELLSHRAKAKDIYLKYEYRVDYEVYIGDPGRVRQILVNLLGNAIKFTAMGGVTLNVYPKKAIGNQYTLKFDIVDTGVGVPHDKSEQIFEQFAQIDATTTRKYGGTGLGLTIAKQLVELMGGDIGLKSKENLGSTFWFEIPFTLSKNQQLSKHSDEILIPKTTSIVAKKILIVDDTDINLKICSAMIEDLGCEVFKAKSGKEALQQCDARKYDVIFMDCFMPDLDGFMVTKTIRASIDNVNYHTPIAALTANANKGIKEQCLSAGMNDLVSKPFKQKDLYEAIYKWVT